MELELIKDADGTQSLTVYVTERDFVRSTRIDHPHFKAIKRLAFEYDAIQEGDDETPGRPLTDDEITKIIDLFDVEEAVNKRFQRLSERYTVKNGLIHKDNDPMPENDPWVQQVLAFVMQGVEDYAPLIRFQEKLDANPNEHSRAQFYRFLSQYPMTITEDGDVVLYKGVKSRIPDNDEDTYVYQSISAGPNTIVDDVEQPNGCVKQGIGSVVEHPRSLVHFNPLAACSNGLHCGTHSYASSFGSLRLRVLVNPRDVVNVPNHDHKVRVCRYVVLDVAERDYSSEALLVRERGVVDEGETVTKGVDPSEAPYVPSAATYDTDEGDTLPDDATEPAAVQNGSDGVSDFYCFGCETEHDGTCEDPRPAPVEDPDESDYCAECGSREDDCNCEDELSDAGQLEADLMESIATPLVDLPFRDAKPPRKRYPSPAKWDEIQAERKARKKGIRKLADREGWSLDGDDPNERKSWVIPPKS